MDENIFSPALLDTIGALVVVCDRERRIIRFNRACEKTTGYSFAEVKDRLFDIFLTPAEVHGEKTVFQRLLSGESMSPHENHWVTKAGRLRLIAWSNIAFGNNGKAEFIVMYT